MMLKSSNCFVPKFFFKKTEKICLVLKLALTDMDPYKLPHYAAV